MTEFKIISGALNNLRWDLERKSCVRMSIPLSVLKNDRKRIVRARRIYRRAGKKLNIKIHTKIVENRLEISDKPIKPSQEKWVFEPFWDKSMGRARMQYYEDEKGTRKFIVEPEWEEIRH